MELIQVLKDARDIAESGWTQKTQARDMGGNECAADDEVACSFCFIGSLRRATRDLPRLQRFNLIDDAIETVKDQLRSEGRDDSIVAFNDNAKTSKEDVLRLFNRTIASLEFRS